MFFNSFTGILLHWNEYNEQKKISIFILWDLCCRQNVERNRFTKQERDHLTKLTQLTHWFEIEKKLDIALNLSSNQSSFVSLKIHKILTKDSLTEQIQCTWWHNFNSYEYGVDSKNYIRTPTHNRSPKYFSEASNWNLFWHEIA